MVMATSTWKYSDLKMDRFTYRHHTSKIEVLVKLQRNQALVGIKLLHTAAWLLFAGCVIAIPFVGARLQLGWVAFFTSMVLLECAVLATNHGRCPSTDWAARYTEERADNFDIYLPLWLARRNKAIFGTLFVAGEFFVLARWLISLR